MAEVVTCRWCGTHWDVTVKEAFYTCPVCGRPTSAIKTYWTVALHCARQLTATQADLFAFQMPRAATLVEVSATSRASSGSSPTLDIEVKEAGTTVLSAAMSITAGAVTVGAISDSEIADNAKITVDATLGGDSPTWDDTTVFLLFKSEVAPD